MTNPKARPRATARLLYPRLPYHYQIDSAPQRRKRRRRLRAFLWLSFWAVCVTTAFHLAPLLTHLK